MKPAIPLEPPILPLDVVYGSEHGRLHDPTIEPHWHLRISKESVTVGNNLHPKRVSRGMGWGSEPVVWTYVVVPFLLYLILLCFSIGHPPDSSTSPAVCRLGGETHMHVRLINHRNPAFVNIMFRQTTLAIQVLVLVLATTC